MAPPQLAIAAFLALAGTVVAHAAVEAPGACGRQPTVGDLARSVARAVEAAGPEGARLGEQVLNSVRGRMNELLTEGAAAAVLKTVGADVATSAPGRLMGPAKFRTLLRQVEGTFQLAESEGRPLSSDVSSTSIDDCFQRRNHGECVECCKELGGEGNFCAKECFLINKPSPSEPLP